MSFAISPPNQQYVTPLKTSENSDSNTEKEEKMTDEEKQERQENEEKTRNKNITNAQSFTRGLSVSVQDCEDLY